MAISNFFLKKFQKLDNLYVLFCQTTRIPYIECDEETFDDQVFVFTREERAKEILKQYLEEKQLVLGSAKLPKAQILPFLGSLYAYGVNAVLLEEDAAEPVRIRLEQLAKKPDIEAMKNDKVPRLNPDVQLTCAYFLQEARRKVKERSKEEMKRLHDMEEEMAVNLFRSRFIFPVDLSATGGKPDPANPNYKIPFLKMNNGDTYVPCFSDLTEYQKFSLQNKQIGKELKLSLVPVPYDALAGLYKDGKGVVLNPAGINLIMTRELLQKLKENYGGQE